VEAWAGWFAGAEALEQGGATAPARPLPASLRRRITPLGRRALEAAWAVLPEGAMPRLVLSSRHGEYQRTFDLLGQLATEGTVSPADFSLSVHHALAGLLSIVTGGDGGHTAVSAGAESFSFGLIEAVGCAVEDQAGAILLHFDAPLPEIYHPVAEPDRPELALALRLAPPGSTAGIGLDLVLDSGGWGEGDAGLAEGCVRVLRGAAVAEMAGPRFGWCWRRAGGGDDA
jgi:hypothetical protein